MAFSDYILSSKEDANAKVANIAKVASNVSTTPPALAKLAPLAENSSGILNTNFSNISNFSISSENIINPAYAKSRMQELGLTDEDITGKNDPAMALDPDELKHVLECVEAFDLWLEHVHLHKEMRRFAIGPYNSLAIKEPS